MRHQEMAAQRTDPEQLAHKDGHSRQYPFLAELLEDGARRASVMRSLTRHLERLEQISQRGPAPDRETAGQALDGLELVKQVLIRAGALRDAFQNEHTSGGPRC